MHEKSAAQTCRNTRPSTSAQTHIFTNTGNDELQRILVCKQIGMRNYIDHRLAKQFVQTWLSFVSASKIQTARGEESRACARIFTAACFLHLKSVNAEASSWRLLAAGLGSARGVHGLHHPRPPCKKCACWLQLRGKHVCLRCG